MLSIASRSPSGAGWFHDRRSQDPGGSSAGGPCAMRSDRMVDTVSPIPRTAWLWRTSSRERLMRRAQPRSETRRRRPHRSHAGCDATSWSGCARQFSRKLGSDHRVVDSARAPRRGMHPLLGVDFTSWHSIHQVLIPNRGRPDPARAIKTAVALPGHCSRRHEGWLRPGARMPRRYLLDSARR